MGQPKSPLSAMQFDLINLYAALERLGADEELLCQAAQEFLDAVEDSYQAVVRAVEAGDASALRIAAHSVKGAARNFGAYTAQHAAYRLEIMGQLNDLEGADSALVLLRSCLDDLKPEMRRLAARV